MAARAPFRRQAGRIEAGRLRISQNLFEVVGRRLAFRLGLERQ